MEIILVILLGLSGCFLLVVSGTEENIYYFWLGVALLLLSIGFSLDVGRINTLDKVQPTIKLCEKELPRTQTCVMMAIPKHLLKEE